MILERITDEQNFCSFVCEAFSFQEGLENVVDKKETFAQESFFFLIEEASKPSSSQVDSKHTDLYWEQAGFLTLGMVSGLPQGAVSLTQRNCISYTSPKDPPPEFI